MTRIVAMVPVRKGSQRVPGKNARAFAGTTLLDLKLEVLSGVGGISEVVVSTDCEECMGIARNRGVTVQVRDDHYAGSAVSNDIHWRHIAESTPGDIVFMTQVTSPLVRRSTHARAIRLYQDSLERHDSLNSVSPEKKFLWLDGKPINYDIDRTPKSQDLPDITSLNFAITIIDRALMIERGNVVGRTPQFIVFDKLESVDVDDMTDFVTAESIFLQQGRDWLLD
ncbi:cytidylyltransferase domain-containing protein [Allopontixanthobacter sp.]|uniref:acylneuraminate cytidylyltransferase family protein n=1 Tax=Allopontixanthobacter sp. TaxID=2906452 RepID=UPI002ABB3202|nr:hypothetical protein [Allopontixanthobacter sp.]MDZ4307484.1 hypothetical protein [Allopontixanthobacter sp.]